MRPNSPAAATTCAGMEVPRRWCFFRCLLFEFSDDDDNEDEDEGEEGDDGDSDLQCICPFRLRPIELLHLRGIFTINV